MQYIRKTPKRGQRPLVVIVVPSCANVFARETKTSGFEVLVKLGLQIA
jgi:hypothetical protein